MVELINKNKLKPYLNFYEYYNKALALDQSNIEAINISTYDINSQEVDCRYVNLKLIDDEKWIFFTNYNSPKSLQMMRHPKISTNLFWASINVQIRIKANIKKVSKKFNEKYFMSRSPKKNALAISSNQSKPIKSYSQVIENYNKSLKNDDLKKCPEFWGGYSFTPYYFEFWEGHESRLNKREVYEKNDDIWKHLTLQP